MVESPAQSGRIRTLIHLGPIFRIHVFIRIGLVFHGNFFAKITKCKTRLHQGSFLKESSKAFCGCDSE
jgi:hypothetical protein